MKITKSQLENIIKKELLKENLNQVQGINKPMIMDEMIGLIILCGELADKLEEKRGVIATSDSSKPFITDFENFSLFETRRKVQALLKELDKIKSSNISENINEYIENEGPNYASSLEKISKVSEELVEKVKQEENLPSWIQDKITISEHNVEAISNYFNIDDDLLDDEMDEAEYFLEKSNKFEYINESNEIFESEYKGKKVKLGKPMRGDVKKYKVYVNNDKGNVVKVNFGDPNMEIKRDNPKRRKAFRDRHDCGNKKDRTKAGYWSCKMWSNKSVSNILKGK